MNVSIHRTVFFPALLVCCLLCFPDPGVAGPHKGLKTKKGQRGVTLQVRSVHASEHVDDARGSEAIKLDGMLEDIREKLQQLPYRSFQVATARNIVVYNKKKTSVKLTEGQELCVRMHYVSKDRIGIWLKWHGHQGEELLNTRIHIDPGSAIIAGAEGHDKNQARILAIKVID